jgi:hypothetical protein
MQSTQLLNRNLILIPILILAASAAGAEAGPRAAIDPMDRALTSAKLRQYCVACHGIGELRFIPSNSDDALWDYIFLQYPPGGTRVWAERIVELLDWPSDIAPSVLDEPQWMPKGAKRAAFAADSTNGVKTRRLMLSTIRAALASRRRPR